MGVADVEPGRPDGAGEGARRRGDVAVGYAWRNAGFFPADYEYIGHIAPAGSASSTAVSTPAT